LKIRGRHIEAERFGPAQGPTLVFLHEGLGSLKSWRDFPERLSHATGLGAFVHSRAGYGQSDPAPLPRPISYMHDEAELLPEILKEAGIAEPILVGHSDGASIAILYKGNGGAARALILEAPHVFAEESGLQSIARMRDQYPQLKERLARWHKDPDAAFWGWNGPWLDPEFRKWNIENSLSHIEVPILLIQGEEDEYGTGKQLEAIAAQARGPVETLLLPQCGHSPHRDQPERTLLAMVEFLRKHRLLPT